MVDASRVAEQKELQWWARRGWVVERGWKEARYVGAGRVVAVPRDFFGHYDLLGLWRGREGLPAWYMVGVQVSLRGIRSNRKAHGPPLFALEQPLTTAVEAFAERPPRLTPGFYEVLASYGKEGTVREWWQAGPRRRRKTGLDLWVEA